MNKTEPKVTDVEVKQDHAEETTSFIQPTAAWPTQPQQLTVSRRENFLYWIFDLGLILLPVALLVKIVLVIVAEKIDQQYNGASIDLASDLSRQLVRLNDQLVTLFTVVFVTIMSTFVKRYALWKAQRGARLSELEQLQGSVSLPSAAKLIWVLGSWNSLSLALLLAWSFYYTGSQAVKNEYRLSESGYKHGVPIVIQRFDSPSLFEPQIGSVLNTTSYADQLQTFTYTSGLDYLNYIFASALYTSQIQDSLRSPSPVTNLIPDFPHLSTRKVAYANLKDRVLRRNQGWIDVTSQAQKGLIGSIPYTSLTPIAGALYSYHDSYWDQTTNIVGSYTISNASYLSVNCSDFIPELYSNFPAMSSNYTVSLNATSPRLDLPHDSQGHALQEFTLWWRGMLLPYTSNSTAFAESVQSYFDPTYNGTLTPQPTALKSTCNITTKHVDLGITCGSSGCLVSRMRWTNNTDETTATSFSTPFSSQNFTRDFFSNMILSTGPQRDFTSIPRVSASSQYVDISISSIYRSWMAGLNVSALQSLSVPFNTYYSLSQYAISPGMMNLRNQSHFTPMNEQDEFFFTVETDAAPYLLQYRVYWQWIPLDIIANLVLLAAAIAACWLRVNTIAPDIFGYVSSLTRDNPDLALPSEASSLDGISRARLLRHVKVRIGEVPARVHSGGSSSSSSSSGIEAGRITLAPVDARIGQLRRDHIYA